MREVIYRNSAAIFEQVLEFGSCFILDIFKL